MPKTCSIWLVNCGNVLPSEIKALSVKFDMPLSFLIRGSHAPQSLRMINPMSGRYIKAPPAEGLARNYTRGNVAAKRYTRQIPEDVILNRVRKRMEDIIRAELLEELQALNAEQAS